MTLQMAKELQVGLSGAPFPLKLPWHVNKGHSLAPSSARRGNNIFPVFSCWLEKRFRREGLNESHVAGGEMFQKF